MKKWIALALFAALATTAGWLYAHGKLEIQTAKTLLASEPSPPQTKDTPPPTVTVTPVAERNFTETVLVTGSLAAREEVVVAPEVSGQRIIEIAVDVGDEVKAGDILALLVITNLEAQLAQNGANLARATAAKAQARSASAQAGAQLAEAQSALARAAKLRTSGNMAQSIYDQRLSAERVAAARLESANEGIKVAEAEIAQVEAARRELVWKRDRGAVTAPAAGIISRRLGQVGAVAAASPMFHIIRNGEVELAAEVPASALAKIKVGQPAVLRTAAGEDVKGSVRLISPEVDSSTRLGLVRIFLGRADHLRIGMFASGRIETARSTGLSIPLSAVMYDAKSAYVLANRNRKAVRQDVTLGLRTGDRIEVRSGLSAGDQVVATAGTFLRDGDPITPVTAAANGQKRISDVR